MRRYDFSRSAERLATWLERRAGEERGAVFAVKTSRIAGALGMPLVHAALLFKHLQGIGLAERISESRSTYLIARGNVGEIVKELRRVAETARTNRPVRALRHTARYTDTMTVKMPLDLLIRLDTYAAANDMSRSEAIRRAIAMYLDYLTPEDARRHRMYPNRGPRFNVVRSRRVAISFHIDPDTYLRLAKKAHELHVLKGELVRAAVAKLLSEAEEEVGEEDMPLLVGRI